MPISDLGEPHSHCFSCEKCEQAQSPRRMVEHQGRCRRCDHDRWLLELEFQPTGDSDAYTLAKWGISLAISGLSQSVVLPGDSEQHEDPNRFSFRGVSAKHAYEVCRGKNLGARLLKYTEYRLQKDAEEHRERMKERGGECPQCGTVFVRNQNREWTLDGYCSRVCRARHEQRAPEDPLGPGRLRAQKPTEQPRESKLLPVRCSGCGNMFEVPKMYRGTARACPECGEKTTAE